MNNRIRKEIKRARQHFVRTVLVPQSAHDYLGTDCDLTCVLAELGMKVYPDPATTGTRAKRYIISNKPLTVKWYLNWYKHNGTVEGVSSNWAELHFKLTNPNDELPEDE
jgi:hypothetical protein